MGAKSHRTWTRPLRTVLGLVVGYAAALSVLAVAANVAARSGPEPRAIEEGAYIIPYQGYLEMDGAPFDGTFSVEATLRSGTDAVTESTVATAASGVFAVEIGVTTPLPEWVFTRDDVTLTLTVNGTVLGSPQRLYPARAAVHRLEDRDVAFTGQTTVGDQLQIRGTSTPSWTPGDPIQVALRDGVGLGGEGLGAAYYTANGFAFDTGSGRGSSADRVELQLQSAAASVLGRLDVGGQLTVGGDVTLDGADDPGGLPRGGWVVIPEIQPSLWSFGAAGNMRLRPTFDGTTAYSAGFDAARSISVGVDETELFRVSAATAEIPTLVVDGNLRFLGATQVVESPFGLIQNGERVECPAGEVMVGLQADGFSGRYNIVCTDSTPSGG